MDGQAIHKNHRERLRERYLAEGADGFQPHNLLELLLFYAIPRRDTNPTAHGLLSAFGSPENVLTAGREELCRVFGVAEHTADFLLCFGETMRRAANEMPCREALCLDAATFGKRFLDYYAGDFREGLTMLLLDNNGRRIATEFFFPGSLHSPGFSAEEAVRTALLFRATACVLAHSHPGKKMALPTQEDLYETRRLYELFSGAGIGMLEHFLVQENGYCTLLRRSSAGAFRKNGVLQTDPEQKTTGQDSLTPKNEGGENSPCKKEEEKTTKAVFQLAKLFSLAGCPEKEAVAIGETFGGLRPAASAEAGTLMRRAKIGRRAAILVSLLGQCHRYIMRSRPVPPPEKEEDMAVYLSGIYRLTGEERPFLLFFDKKGRVVGQWSQPGGTVNAASFSPRTMVERAISLHADAVLLSHNHPDGPAFASREDHDATLSVLRALDGVGMRFLGHYIIGLDGYSVITRQDLETADE